MPGGHVLKQGDYIVHLDGCIHRSNNITGREFWKVLVVEHDPGGENSRAATTSRHGKTQVEYFSKAVVSARFGLIRGGCCRQDGRTQHFRIGLRDAQRGFKDPRFIPALPVQRIQRIILQLRAEIAAMAVGQFHLAAPSTNLASAARFRKMTRVTSFKGVIEPLWCEAPDSKSKVAREGRGRGRRGPPFIRLPPSLTSARQVGAASEEEARVLELPQGGRAGMVRGWMAVQISGFVHEV
jgi:hypothetical protein